MDDKLAKRPVHIVVYMVGQCPACKKTVDVPVYDYGLLPYKKMEDKMGEVNHAIHNLICKCGQSFLPRQLIYRNKLQNGREVMRIDIDHGSLRMPGDSEEWKEGHDKRKDIFAEQSDVFWAAYIDFALEDWRAAINELTKIEIASAYAEMGIAADLRTDAHARRDAINRIQSDEDKRTFWRRANHGFIYDDILDIGPVGWVPQDYIKEYGLRRTQFVIMHFPIAAVHEPERTKAMAQVFKREKGDNAFLLRRLAMISDQHDLTKRKLSEAILEQDNLKVEIAKLQKKLSISYKTIEYMQRDSNPIVVNRDPADRRKINNQKRLISELIAEVKRLRALVPLDADTGEQGMPADDQTTDVPTAEIDLTGTLGVIGGDRSEQASNASVPVVAVDGNDEAELQAALSKANYIAVLTRHVSHHAMWTAKAYAIDKDIPIIFTTAINLDRVIDVLKIHIANKI